MFERQLHLADTSVSLKPLPSQPVSHERKEQAVRMPAKAVALQ